MAGPSDSPMAVSTVEIILDMFSGRPNPSWTLSPATTAEFMRRLAGLPKAEDVQPPSDGLGYRAVKARFNDQRGDVTATIAGGFVTVDRGGPAQYYRDQDRNFEIWLMDTGMNKVPAELLKVARASIAARSK